MQQVLVKTKVNGMILPKTLYFLNLPWICEIAILLDYSSDQYAITRTTIGSSLAYKYLWLLAGYVINVELWLKNY